MRTWRLTFVCGGVATALLVASCAVTPEPLNASADADRVRLQRERTYADQEPVRAPLTLEEAAARAIKYNLDHRLLLMEGAMQQRVRDVSRFDLLPRLTASAGYVTRDSELYSQYQTLGHPYHPDLPFSHSTQSNRLIAGAELSWNLLDFGLSYYRAHSQSDQVLLAEERKRKVVQNVMQDVRSAYWRALGAQRLSGPIDELLTRTETALERARAIERQGLLPVPQALGYQRALLDMVSQLQSRRQDLELSRAELASLMNLPPGTRFSLSDLLERALPSPPESVAKLEDVALNNRPELGEKDYRRRISVTEARRALASTLPALSFDGGAHYDSNNGSNDDSNKLLLTNAWVESGIRVSLNLFRLAAIPTTKRLGEGQEQVAHNRRMAQAMAVLTQVRVATLRYGLARAEYDTYAEGAEVDERLVGYARASAGSRIESDLELIRSEARAILSQYQRHIAYGNAQAAWGRVYNSLGLDVQADDRSVPVRALAIQIRRAMLHWQARTFDTVAIDTIETLPIALEIDGAGSDAERAEIAALFAKALRQRGMRVVDGPDPAGDARVWRLQARRQSVTEGSSTQLLEWAIELFRPNGSSVGRTLYSNMVPAAGSASTRLALTLAAASINADVVIEWLESERQRTLALRR